MAQRVGRVIVLPFHDRGTRSSMLRPYFTPGKDPVPIVQDAGWASGPVWTGGKSRPHRDCFLKQTIFIVTLVAVEIRLHFLQGQTIHTAQRTNSIGVTSMYLSVMEYAIELLAW